MAEPSKPASSCAIDWESVAAFFIEQDPRSLVLLDRDGVIRVANEAFAALLESPRDELIGQPWIERFVPIRWRVSGDAYLKAVLRGTTRRVGCLARTGEGRGLQLEIEFTRVGEGDSVGVLGTVVSATPTGAAPTGALRYEISSRSHDFGTVLRIHPGHLDSDPAVGQRCYQLLYQRGTPCPGCPARPDATSPWPRTAVLRPPGDSSPFHIVTAESLDATTVRLTVQLFSDETLGRLVRAKLESLSEQAHLSDREQLVLQHLVRGSSLDEIATALQISARTVKFHQSNVLAKLNVRSRTALLRLIF